MAAAIPVIVGAGFAFQGVSQILAANAQADAERANADFLREQARFAQFASQREEEIFRSEATEFEGELISSFAKAGVDLSGSPLLRALQNKERIRDEIEAIREGGRLQVSIASKRAQAADDFADSLTSFGSNFFRVGGTLLTGAGNTLIAAQRVK